jgi:hypothetical protein
VIILNPQDDGKVNLTYREITVTYLDVDHPPSDDDFRTVIAAGCQVKDPNDLTAIYVEKEERSVSAATLGEVSEKLDLAAEKTKALRALREAELPPKNSMRWFWIGQVILVAILAAVYVLWRLRRSRQLRTAT